MFHHNDRLECDRAEGGSKCYRPSWTTWCGTSLSHTTPCRTVRSRWGAAGGSGTVAHSCHLHSHTVRSACAPRDRSQRSTAHQINKDQATYVDWSKKKIHTFFKTETSQNHFFWSNYVYAHLVLALRSDLSSPSSSWRPATGSSRAAGRTGTRLAWHLYTGPPTRSAAAWARSAACTPPCGSAARDRTSRYTRPSPRLSTCSTPEWRSHKGLSQCTIFK